MAIRKIITERYSLVSDKPFAEVVAGIEKGLGKPDIKAMYQRLASVDSFDAYKKIVDEAAGPTGLLLFLRLDLGSTIRRDTSLQQRQVVRFVAGNPLIMKEMVSRVPDGGSYAPVTILVDERDDGVHLSYDLMASFLAPYGDEEALRVARDLDAKVIRLLTSAA